MKYIASCSCGNDSMAMIYELVKRKYPLNEIVFCSNGMDFKAIYHLWEQVKARFEPLGIVCTELKPDYQFTDKMFNILVVDVYWTIGKFDFSFCPDKIRIDN